MNQENWCAVTPQYDQFSSQLNQFSALAPLSFFDMQPRLKQVLTRFEKLSNLSRMLLINAPDNSIYHNIIVDGLKQEILLGTEKPIIKTESLDINSLFDQYSGTSSRLIPGLMTQAQGGYLIISANLILANPSSWGILKSAVLGDAVPVINCDPRTPIESPQSHTYDVKLIIMGDRSQLGDIDYLDSDIQTGLCLFAELEMDIKLNEDNLSRYLGYLKWISLHFQLPNLTMDALPRLLTACARETEDQTCLPLCVIWHNALLAEAAINSNSHDLSSQDLDTAIEHKYYGESYLPLRALDDILDGQVLIETTGERIGQINALTVIDVPGHPISYGEPARVSCIVHFGDGDVSDIERKAELGGNLHAKGMMIIQAFVSRALNLDESLPYTASIAFEQSYSEIDGDSASFAELCSLVSALSECPINQQIAVTGSVDQFGRIQAVGGLNEKIEGFYHVCQHQGFTGHQGVILPAVNMKHLALHKDVVESIKNGEFHIWSVSNVDEAIPLILGKPFQGEDEDSIVNKITQRIENFERHEHPPGLVGRIRNWFV